MARWKGTFRAAPVVWVICGVGIAGLTSGMAAARPPEPPAGALDLGFGTGGIVLTPEVPLLGSPSTVVIQEDGKIVTGGTETLPDGFFFVLVRFRRDGAPDPTFGVGGMVTTPIAGGPSVSSLLLQRDGRIVVVGSTGANPTTGAEKIVLVRYRRDGQLDPDFGTNGLVFDDFGPDTSTEAVAGALQPDGRLVVVGLTTAGGPGSSSMLVRYEQDGSLDATFGVGGRVIADLGNSVAQFLAALAFTSDGKIVTVGNSKVPGRGGFTGTLARFNHDGSIDTTFGNNGSVLRQFGGITDLSAVALQRDGRIVVGGSAPADPQVPGAFTGLVARFEADGTPDASFGSGGLIFNPTAPLESAAIDRIAIDRCGRIVAVGVDGALPRALAVFRYDRDGSRDPAFGNGGEVTTALDGLLLEGNAVALEREGDIVATGAARSDADPSLGSLFIARYEEGRDRRCECGF